MAAAFSDFGVARKLWGKRARGAFIRGKEVEHPKGPIALLEAGETLGFVGLGPPFNHRSWGVCAEADVSPGALNPRPAPILYLPEDEWGVEDLLHKLNRYWLEMLSKKYMLRWFLLLIPNMYLS